MKILIVTLVLIFKILKRSGMENELQPKEQ